MRTSECIDLRSNCPDRKPTCPRIGVMAYYRCGGRCGAKLWTQGVKILVKKCIPRTRGDDPWRETWQRRPVWYSPHTRG